MPPFIFHPRWRFARLGMFVLTLLALLIPAGITLASPSKPVASLSAPASGFLGEPIALTVSFDNTDTTDPGYGPYVDLILPAAGADGAGAATDDGITFSSATYLGTSLTPVVPPFICSGGTFNHPLTGLATACTNDTQLAILQLPFGSFTATQPPAAIQVAANVSNLADVNTALTIRARAGFAYGNDALINPIGDPPIVQATPASTTFTPVLFKLIKTYRGPEDETATGPNYPRQYRLDVDIATGQTITNLDISDILPNTMQFVGVDSMLINNAPAAATAIATPITTVPGGTLTRRFASIAGTAGTQDASVLFTFYIPRLDAASAAIIAPTTGDDVPSLNNASTGGNWTPLDGRDSASAPTINIAGPEHTLTDKSIAIQKGVANKTDASHSPGDVLEYTLDIQISDFFAFDTLIVDDTFSDGQHWDATFAPTLQVNGNTYTLATAPIAAANYTVTPNYTPAAPAPNDGTTAVQFRLSNELITRGQNGQLIGGCVSAAGTGLISPCNVVSGSGNGPTTAQITFRTVILDKFTDDYLLPRDANVDEGDVLGNSVTVGGNVLNNVGLTATGQSEVDTSAASLSIARGDLSKTIYAVNGIVCASQPCTNVAIKPGDTVTYRLQRDVLTTDVEQLKLIDYLPLPIFDVDDNTAPVVSRISSFSTTVSAAAPAAGTAKLGPADTFFAKTAINPFTAATANDSIANSVTFDYGSFNDPANTSAKIDLLFTVTANSAPFGDGLFLTNQLREQSESTNAGTQIVDAIVQLKLFEPVLNIRKGVVASYVSTGNNTATGTISGTPLPAGVTVGAPGSCARINGTVQSGNLGTTFTSDLTGVDAGTRVTFAVVVENSGTSALGEFDARVRDALPVGLTFVPGSLCVTDGTGATISYTTLGGGLFDSAGGIELDDPGPTATPVGALDPGKNLDGSTRTDGRNIAIVTYDATVDASTTTNQTLVNAATLYNYSSLEGGIDHTIVDQTDTATVTTAPPAMTKTLVDTSIVSGSNSNTQAVIGELVTYQLVVTVPEGVTPSAQIVDTLDSGLAFVDITSVTSSAGVSMSTPIGLGASPANVTVGAGGRPITFSPGTITNSNTSNAAATITIVYRAVVLDIAANQNTPVTLLNNSALFSSANGTLPATSAANVTVIEPTLSIGSVATPSTGDAGDTITFDLTIANTAAGTTDAFDIALSDLIPAGMTYVPSSLVNLSGPAATLNDAGAPTLSAAWATLAPGSTSVIRFQVTLDATVTPGQSVSNSATVTWTSLSGTPGQRSTYTTSSTERTGAGGVDDYTRSSSAAVTVPTVAPTKSIVTTSEAHTSEAASPLPVAVGEIVRYRLAVQLPEGAAPDVQINDNLPAGLTFLNDGSARLAFVSNGGGISSASAQAGAIPALACANDSGSAADLISLTPAQVDCALADAHISTSSAGNADAYASDTDVRFKLGTLTNADSDANAEFVVVEFNALVDNSAAGGNDAGDTLTNSFSVFLNATAQNGPTSGNVQLKVVEPAIPFNTATNNKTVSPSSGDAGDTVTYTVVYTNANGANTTDAFDVRVVDAVPAAATLNLASINVSASVPCASPTFINSSAVNTVDITLSRVAPGCQITISYQATLTTAVMPGQLITNTANLTYTSLPGANGTGSSTPGAAGTDLGERDGSGGAINDYSGSASATVTVFVPAPVKSLVSTSEADTTGTTVVVGEVARFRMVVRVAEGSSPTFELRDNLPAGLRFLNDGTATLALVSSGAGLSSATLGGAGLLVTGNETTVAGVTPTFVLPAGAISGGSGGGGAFLADDDPLLALGTLTNADRDPDQELVVVELNALVENAAGNQSGTSLDNTFAVRVGGSDVATSNTQSVVVAEPNVTTTKQVLSTNGSTVTYRVVAANTGSVTAFDAIVGDILPAALDLNIGAIAITPAGGATGGTANHSDPANRVEFDNVTLPAGGSVTITYQANVLSPGITIANSAATSYTSLPGSGTAGNPTGSNTPGASGAGDGERAGSGGTNDYSSSAGQSLGSAGDRVWYDVDADGVLDAGEVGMPGVTVTVRWFGPDGVEGTGDDSVIATATDSTGGYLVSALPLGAGPVNYRVTVDPATLPNGLTSITYDLDNGTSSPNGNTVLALTSGNANPRNADVGYRGAASLGDRVWLDSNGNGVQDAAALEPGLPGAGVTLIWFGFDGLAGGGDDVTYTTTTGANGVYSFANLPAGTFRADVTPATLPTNLTATYDLNGAPDGSATRVLAIGESAANVNFGYRGPASIGDTVWNDVDGNGAQNNAEPGIPGATVTLRWAGVDGALGTADDLTYTTTTDASGSYAFPGLPVYDASDLYRVTLTPPAAYTAPTFDSDGVGTAGQSTLSLGASETNTAQDFGYRASLAQGLSNFVWEDLNGNGRQDGGEPGVDGVTVELYDSAGTSLLATTTTAGGGSYSFPGLVAGTYQVKFGRAPGYDRTAADVPAATDTADSDANVATGFTAQVTVTAGVFNTSVDAGLYRSLAIGDFVWYDRDGDGVQDAGEAGLGGATVTLTWYGPDGAAGGGDDQTYTSTTNSAGAWSSTNLPPGSYGVVISTLPNGLTTQTAGPSTVTLVSGSNRTDIDFGYRGAGSLGDSVWLDRDGNGVRDAGEAGIGGATVTLTWYGPDGAAGGGDDLTTATTTADDGSYSFSNLPAGAFRVDVGGLPGGVSPTFDLDGIASANTADASLTAGQTRADLNFGYVGAGSLGNVVWLDRDGDGVQDAGEPGIADATVTLIWAGLDNIFGNGDDITMTTATDDAGSYQFTGLPAGDYRVTVDPATLPGGLSPTSDGDGLGSPHTADASLSAGQTRADLDFGYVGMGAIGDRVWFDTDGDGGPDAGEPGLGGVGLTITWYGPDGLAGGGDDASFSTTSAADGSYSIGGLPAGSYSVDVDLASAPSGTTLTSANDPLAVSLSAGQTYATADFGVSGTSSLGDAVWLDRDGNGVPDAGEPGIADATVTVVWGGPDGDLTTVADNLTYTAITNDSGAYSVPHLAAGPYRVTVDPATLPGGLSPTFDGDGLGSPHTADASLSAGQTRADLDFGYVGMGAIGDFVWLDKDGDGGPDAGEPGLGGVGLTITWYGPDGLAGGGDDASFSTTSAADGSYSVGGLPAGSYSVDVDLASAPSGTTLTSANDPLALTLTAGQTYATADFGVSGAGAIGNRVWLDLSGDGVPDAGEPGLPGVTVTLTWYGPDGAAGGGDDVSSTTTTGANGAYSFTNLPAGAFHVDVSGLPGGVSATYDLDGAGSANTTAVALTAGQIRVDANFGYAGGGSIGDLVWVDANGDQAQDVGEPGLNAVDVTLTWAGLDGAFGTADDIALIATTSASGAYTVGGLPAGNYRVDVDQTDAPSGTMLTTANDPLSLTLAASQVYTTADFGFKGTTSLGDRVWNDLNGDGAQQPSEPGIAGVTVTATWFGPDGVLGGGDDIRYTTMTDANGYYRITDLLAGNYSVVLSGTPLASLTATYDLDGTSTPGATATNLSVGQNRVDADFGYRDPAPAVTGSIGDRVWNDTNGDGAQQIGEPGIAGVTVRLIAPGADRLFGTADDQIAPTTTGANGDYSFGGLAAGDYRILIDASTLPAGLVETFELDGSLNESTGVSLSAGETRGDVDFGYQSATTGGTTGSIGDRVWNDANGNSLQEGGESGIAGVTVTLTGAGADDVFGTADDTTATTTTGANGDYSFSALATGFYRVSVAGAPLNSLHQTYELDGSPDRTTIVTLASGQDRADVDFGFTSGPVAPATGSIGDRLWLDLDGDGTQDGGEPGQSGSTIDLIWYGRDGVAGGGDDVSYVQVTGSDGGYSFPNLPAGAYAVTVDITTLPPGLAASYDLDGGADGTAAVTLANGQTRTDVDFGYQGMGSIGDRVWNDADGDRLQGAGESGIAGVTVTLTGSGSDGLFGTADDLGAVTTTGAGGFYSVGGLPAGSYRVTVGGAPLGGLGETYELDGSLDGATTVTLAGGQDRRDVDFGYVAGPPAATGSIGDRIWLDRDGDGAQDAGEPGLPGAVVNLIAAGADGAFGTADDVIATQIADANGNYGFTNLPAGNYRVDVDEGTLPAGVSATAERDATLDGQTTIALGVGQVVRDADFGYQDSGALGDRIWFDKDGDGTQDQGEPGLAGVTVRAAWYGPDDQPGGGDDVTFTTTTDANGSYTFGGLPLGTYAVHIDAGVPAGAIETAELDATLNGSTQVSLIPSAPRRTDVDFGYTGTGSISQTIWLDSNRNGVIDPTENGIGGVSVTLVWAGPDGVLGTADDVTYTTSTDANGRYNFPNLPAGIYTVTIDPATLPPGLVPTYDKDGGTDSTTSVNLGAGQRVPDINFGYGTNPTAVTLVSFTAQRQGDRTIAVRWVTSAEIHTWGFHIVRSADGDRTHAQRVTASLILHQGRGNAGATYRWNDTTALPGTTYTYWLEEIELNGTSTIYGPAREQPAVSTTYTLFLPLATR